jgi:predicted lipoprotein with Yx(FWY)xxD motif
MVSSAPFGPASLRRGLVGLAGVGVLVAAGCSSSGGGGGTPTGGGGQPGGPTVSLRTAGGMSNVLADSMGRTLYTSDEESAGKILCTTSDCAAIWTPLTVSTGQQPTGPDSISGKLTTFKRPDGKTQVALDGKPLYTFSFDHGAGQVNGNGTKDSFNGTNFTWHAATSAGLASTAPAPSSTAPAPSSTAPAPSSTDNGGY